MTYRSRRSSWWFLSVQVVCLLWATSCLVIEASSADPLPETASSKTGDTENHYVGTEACIECHRDQHQSYLQTPHSAATSLTDPNSESEESIFDHPISRHRFEVLKKGNKLIHRGEILDDSGNPTAVTEAEVAYTIGSGEHGKSYLYRDGRFWAQSPITWFKETESWGMSPGYDRPGHLSFRRKVGRGCVFCHVGSIDRQDDNPFCFEIIESKIGCERCHGPGEQHVTVQRANPTDDGSDHSIVNPANLTRELSEAICQQCHLQAAAKVMPRGKDEWDYRPGLPLTDFRIDYQYRSGDESMKIVGHVEQMHASKCYQKSETLTCTTCHNPHDTPEPDQVIEHHRNVCYQCHQDEACGKPHAERIEIAKNDCSQCHMPKAETNVAHAAFRQHRIAIYDSNEQRQPTEPKGIYPVISIAQLDNQAKVRADAFAKAQLYRSDPTNPDYQEYGIEAISALLPFKQAGKDDTDMNATLIQLADAQQQAPIAEMLARELLQKEKAPTAGRLTAVRLMAQSAFKKGNREKAVELYRELVTLHRDAYDYYFLGLCENNVGNFDAAIDALKKSIEIDVSQSGAHVALAAIYQAKRQRTEYEYHAKKAAENQELARYLKEKIQELRK